MSRTNYRQEVHDRIVARLRAQTDRERGRTTCAWCRADLGPAPGDLKPVGGASHGICEPCSKKLLAEVGLA